MELLDRRGDVSWDLHQVKFTPSSSPHSHRINYNFRFDGAISQFVLTQDSPMLRLAWHHCSSTFDAAVVTVDAKKTRQDLYNETRDAVGGVLSRQIPLYDPETRENMIESAWVKACRLGIWHHTLERDCMDLDLDFIVRVEDIEVYGNIPDTEGYRMVPAEASSIQLLETYEEAGSGITDEISCCICLEDLSGGKEGGGALRMPCKHVFHGDCIREWLRTSHYCPLCRFEMPTN